MDCFGSGPVVKLAAVALGKEDGKTGVNRPAALHLDGATGPAPSMTAIWYPRLYFAHGAGRDPLLWSKRVQQDGPAGPNLTQRSRQALQGNPSVTGAPTNPIASIM